MQRNPIALPMFTTTNAPPLPTIPVLTTQPQLPTITTATRGPVRTVQVPTAVARPPMQLVVPTIQAPTLRRVVSPSPPSEEEDTDESDYDSDFEEAVSPLSSPESPQPIRPIQPITPIIRTQAVPIQTVRPNIPALPAVITQPIQARPGLTMQVIQPTMRAGPTIPILTTVRPGQTIPTFVRPGPTIAPIGIPTPARQGTIIPTFVRPGPTIAPIAIPTPVRQGPTIAPIVPIPTTVRPAPTIAPIAPIIVPIVRPGPTVIPTIVRPGPTVIPTIVRPGPTVIPIQKPVSPKQVAPINPIVVQPMQQTMPIIRATQTQGPILTELPQIPPIGGIKPQGLASPARQPIVPITPPQITMTPFRRTVIPSPHTVPIIMRSPPKVLAQAPQKTPIGGTITGAPIIPTEAPQIVPLPILVPITEQTQVNYIPRPNSPRPGTGVKIPTRVVVPVIPSPIKTPAVVKVPVIPVTAPSPRRTQVIPQTEINVPTTVRSPRHTAPSPGRVQAIPITWGQIPPTMPSPHSPGTTVTRAKHTHLTKDAIVEHVGKDHVHEGENEECCVCLEKVVSPGKKTACGHAVCANCTKRLPNPTCPTCRKPLGGGYITAETEQKIAATMKKNAEVRNLEDQVLALYITAHPYAPEDEAHSYAEAFSSFLANNANISLTDLERIFEAFVEYMHRARVEDPKLTPLNGIEGFTLIGITMLENPHRTFNELYNDTFRMPITT